MRKLTAENARKVIKNRFELVVLASQRAADLGSGAKQIVDMCKKKYKLPLIALEEIAQGGLDIEQLRDSASERYKRGGKDGFKYASQVSHDKEQENNEMFEKIKNSGEAVFYGDDADEEQLKLELGGNFTNEYVTKTESDEVGESTTDVDSMNDINASSLDEDGADNGSIPE